MNEDMEFSDAGFLSRDSSDMESVNSTNYEFRMKRNRRHHGIANNPYYLPADEEEALRLDALQFLIKTLYGGHNVLVPLTEKPTLIADVGTGSGLWAIEVAKDFPAKVVGLDLAPNQPDEVPQNCEFRIADLTQDLPEEFDDGSVDLMHSRMIHAGVRVDQWPTYINEVFRVLKPGTGWIQCCEIAKLEFENCENSILPQFLQYMQKFHEDNNLVGFDGGSRHLVPLMEAAGFVDIRVMGESFDNGDWRQDQPAYRASASRAAIHAFKGQPLIAENFKRYIPDNEERKAFGKRAEAEIRDSRCHVTFTVYGS